MEKSTAVINSVVALLRNKERRELEFALHLSETADRQQVQDRLVAEAIKTGNSLNPRKRRSSNAGKTAVYSQTSRNTKIKPPIAVLRQRASLASTRNKNMFASQRFGLEGAIHDHSDTNNESGGAEEKKNEEKSNSSSESSDSKPTTPVLNLTVEQKEDEQLKNIRAQIDLPRIKHLLPAYDGDMFGTSGNYWQGQLYMARMTPAQEHVKQNRFNFHQETPRYVAKDMQQVDKSSKQNACKSICNLTWHASNATAVVKEGGLGALQSMCETESDGLIQTNCAIAFHNLSRIPEMRQQLIEHKLVLTLAKAQTKAPNMDPAVVLHLLGTLAALSCSKFEKGVEARLLQQRALDVLAFSAKAMLKIRDGPSRPIILAHTLGARTLLNLTTCFNERTTYDQAIDVITECLARLQHHLISTIEGNIFKIQILLVQALCNIAGYENNRARMVSQGVVGIVVKTWELMKSTVTRHGHQDLDRFRHAAAALVLSLSNCKGELRVMMIRQKSVQLLDDISTSTKSNGRNENDISDSDLETRQRCVQALGNLASGGHGDGRAASNVLPAILKLSKNNDPATRAKCARALRDMSERPYSRKLILEQNANKVLARLMDAEHVYDSEPSRVKVDCLVAICNLLIYPNTQLLAVSVGTVDVMLTTFERGAGKAEKLCCITIQRLLAVENAREYVTNNRTLVMLMNLMTSTNDTSVVEQVTATLAGLVADKNTANQILNLKGLDYEPIESFLTLVRDRDETNIRCSALAALTFLSYLNKELCLSIVEQGASIITDAVIGKSGYGQEEHHYVDQETRMWCGSLLCNLASHPKLRRKIIDHNGCVALSILAKTDSAHVQSCASRTFCYFSDCIDTEPTTSDIVASGAVTSLIALSSAHDESTRSNCATALCNLAWGADLEAARQIVGAGTVNELMILALVRSDSATTKLTCLMALANLLDGGEILEAMVEQGLVWAMTMASSLETMEGDVIVAEKGLALVAAVYSVLVRTELGCQRLISEHGAIKAVARLIGSKETQTARLGWDVLRFMCRRDCQQRLIDEGCLEVLVSMNDSPEDSVDVVEEEQVQDLTVVHNLSALVAFLLRSEDGRTKLVNEAISLLGGMCKVCEGNAEIETRRFAAEVACRLSGDDRTSRIFVVRGGLSNLSDLCRGHFKRSKKTENGYEYENYTRMMLATAFLQISMHADNVKDMIDAGCIEDLTGLAETTDVAVLEKIVAVIRSLAWSEKNHEALVHKYHVVLLLGNIVQRAPCTEAMRLDCADAICNLSYHLSSDSYHDMVQDGVVDMLVQLADTSESTESSKTTNNGNEDENSFSAGFSALSKLRIAISFCHLSAAGNEFAVNLIDRQVLPILITMIKTRGCPLELRRDCLSTLCSLSFSAEERGDEMIAAGVYEVVTRLARSSDRFVRKCCGTVLSNLSPFARDAVEGSVAALLDLCMPTDSDNGGSGGGGKSKASPLQRKSSGALMSADALDESSIPPGDWYTAWKHWNSLSKHGSVMAEGVEIIFLQPGGDEQKEEELKNPNDTTKELFWKKVPAGHPVSNVPQVPVPPEPPSLDEISGLDNPSMTTSFSSILQEDDEDVVLSLQAAKSSSVNFPVGEYVFKDAKSGEAHWLNPRTSYAWPLGPTGSTPMNSPMRSPIKAQLMEAKVEKTEDDEEYDDEEYEDDEDERYSGDEDEEGVDLDTDEQGNLVSSSTKQMVAGLQQRPRSTQSDPASTPGRRRSKQRIALSLSDNESASGDKKKVKKKKNKSAHAGKQTRFVVTKPKREISGERPGDWTDSDDEEDRRVQRFQDPRWSHVPARFPSLGGKIQSQAPRVPQGSEREGTPLAMLSLRDNAQVLGLFQQRR